MGCELGALGAGRRAIGDGVDHGVEQQAAAEELQAGRVQLDELRQHGVVVDVGVAGVARREGCRHENGLAHSQLVHLVDGVLGRAGEVADPAAALHVEGAQVHVGVDRGGRTGVLGGRAGREGEADRGG